MAGDLTQVAQAVKSNGVNGELIMHFRDIDPDEINITEPVFIYFDGLPVPFFIDSISRRSNTKAVVHLVDIDSQEDSEEIVGKAVYTEQFSSEAEAEGFGALIGWTLYAPVSDQDESDEEEIEVEEIGEIIDFLDIPQNPCIEVNTKNGAVTLPLHEDLILDLDPESQEITLIIPDGLL